MSFTAYFALGISFGLAVLGLIVAWMNHRAHQRDRGER